MRLIRRPVLCNYYVTYRCNASCGFCDIWEKPSPYVTVQNFEKNLDDLKQLGVKVIDFTGGEPLLHQEIDVLLKLAKDKGFITTLTTNCLLYPKWAEKICGNVDMLHFSLDSPDKEVHNRMRNVSCFDHVMESIRLAKELGERPDILFTVFNDNVHEIQRMYSDISLPNNLVLILNPVFGYNKIEDGLSADSIAEVSTWSSKRNVYLNDGFLQLRLDGGNHIADPVCKAASSTIVISPENKLILPCYHLGIKHYSIDGNLRELYQSEEVQKLVKLEGRLMECEGCVINCYMQPSFAVNVNKYFWKALPSTIKYNSTKNMWRKLF